MAHLAGHIKGTLITGKLQVNQVTLVESIEQLKLYTYQ